jgi:hypothetical protein
MADKGGPLSVEDAKEYLRLVDTVPKQHLGPHRMFSNPTSDAKPLQEFARRLVISIERRDERTYYAPSPWHAAAWLLDLAALAGQVANLDGSSGLRSPYDTRYGAPVFRGQSDPKQELLPTLLREGKTPSDRQGMEMLASVLQKLLDSEDNRMNGRLTHLAALQHCGMPTPLLDFTADPRIAVSFACFGANPGARCDAGIFCTPLGVLTGLGGAVVLPPPWVKRLYAQRGLFLDFASLPGGVRIEDVCFRLLFPPDPEFKASVSGEADLLPREPWYEAAIRWAQMVARSNLTLKDAAKQLQDECGEPPFLYDVMQADAMLPSLHQFSDMCAWLALKVLNGQLVYDTSIIEAMAVHNMPLFRSHRATWRLLTRTFPDLSREDDLDLEPFLAAMKAVSSCLDEIDSTAKSEK